MNEEEKRMSALIFELARVEQENQINLDEAQQQAQIGSWSWNVQTGKIQWSAEMFRILGMEPGEVEPSFQLALSFIHPDDQQDYLRKLEETTDSGTDFFMQNRILRRDGTIRHVVSKSHKTHSMNSNPLSRLFGTVQDITDQLNLESIEEQNKALEAQVADLERKIIAMEHAQIELNGKIVDLRSEERPGDETE
jgi:PAS domain S-box-containing protein